jgi:tetratricopeptide (TPR) repeat protein
MFILLFFLIANTLFLSCLLANGVDKQDLSFQSVAVIGGRVQLERKGDRLVEQGLYEDAINKYQEALTPQFIKREEDKCQPLARIRHVHRLQGKYRDALNEMDWFIHQNPKKEEYINDKLELEALCKAQNTHLEQPVFEYIKYLREKYKKLLPPIKYDGNYAPIITSKIIYLYDHIGDVEKGIAFCDEILKYMEKKSGQNLHRLGNKNQYFLIRQAFEQDKAEGFKGCLEAKPGEACMGRATKALIQSDYFPW